MSQTDDVRLMHDYKWLKCIHLEGRPRTLEIESCEQGTVEGESGRKSRKPVLRFRGVALPFAISKTDTKTLVSLYGPKASGYVGKLVTLYPTKTTLAGQVVECIRIKPEIPQRGQRQQSQQRPADEPGDARETSQ